MHWTAGRERMDHWLDGRLSTVRHSRLDHVLRGLHRLRPEYDPRLTFEYRMAKNLMIHDLLTPERRQY